MARSYVSAGVAAALAVGLTGLAEAQTPDAAPVATTPRLPDATDARIRALEAQLEALTAEIASMRAGMAADVEKLKAQQSATTTTVASGRPTIATGDGQQKFAVRSVVQFDVAHYDEKGDPAVVEDLSSGTNFRRARIGLEGTFAKDWNYAITGEFGGNAGEAAQLNTAYIEYAGLRPSFLSNPLRLRIGAWATPTGLEDGINVNESLFLERAAVADMVRSLAGADSRSSAGAFANGDHWYADAVLTGAIAPPAATTALTQQEYDEQTGGLLRVAFNPLFGRDYNLHVGVSADAIFDPPDTTAGGATTKVVRLRERPELRVDGTRLVDTGNIPANGLIAYGAELGGQYKNFLLYGEAFKIDVDRTTLFDPSFNGWYIAGAWTLTGETHPWVNTSGGWRGVRPASNFAPADGHWGAWEIAARYSTLDLDDNAGADGAPVPVGGIRGGEQDITTLGLNWYPNAVFRFLLDYQWVAVKKFGAAAPVLNRIHDEDASVVSLRSQFAF